ncbi:hypothetical protein MTO96_048263 [Rhipicephalus appendiculatus]
MCAPRVDLVDNSRVNVRSNVELYEYGMQQIFSPLTGLDRHDDESWKRRRSSSCAIVVVRRPWSLAVPSRGLAPSFCAAHWTDLAAQHGVFTSSGTDAARARINARRDSGLRERTRLGNVSLGGGDSRAPVQTQRIDGRDARRQPLLRLNRGSGGVELNSSPLTGSARQFAPPRCKKRVCHTCSIVSTSD